MCEREINNKLIIKGTNNKKKKYQGDETISGKTSQIPTAICNNNNNINNFPIPYGMTSHLSQIIKIN